MKLAIAVLVVLVIVACAGLTVPVYTLKQFNEKDQKIEFVVKLVLGMEMSPLLVEKLTNEELVGIYTKLAESGLIPASVRDITFNPQIHFRQEIGAEASSEVRMSAELEAKIEATIRDVIGKGGTGGGG